eukprot:2377912-Prymnesium_polylepis.3
MAPCSSRVSTESRKGTWLCPGSALERQGEQRMGSRRVRMVVVGFRYAARQRRVDQLGQSARRADPLVDCAEHVNRGDA